MSSADDLCVRRFRTFVFLWSAGSLFHQGFQGRLVHLDAAAPVTFAALYTLLRPGSLRGFVVLLAVQLAVVAAEMPAVSNHWLLMGVSGAGLLTVLVPALARPEAERAAALRDALRPIRVQIVLVYLWACFHKLNAGFFDPAGSCAAHPVSLLGLRSPALVEISAGAAVALEGGIPLLLAYRPTRKAALLAGWALHLVLGWELAWDFSAVATAYYAAFVPGSLIRSWSEERRSSRWLGRACAEAARFARWRFAFPLLAGALAALLAWGAAHGVEAPSFGERRGAFLPWLVVWLGLGAVLVRLVWVSRRADEPVEERASWRWPAALLTIPVVALNGTAPYLGLGTEHSFSMFSNLRTEADEWNHWLVPRSVRVFGFQDELVRVTEAESGDLRWFAHRGYRIVPFELRRRVQEQADAPLAYRRGDREIRVERAADDPFLAPPNRVLAKLMRFRIVLPEGVVRCFH